MSLANVINDKKDQRAKLVARMREIGEKDGWVSDSYKKAEEDFNVLNASITTMEEQLQRERTLDTIEKPKPKDKKQEEYFKAFDKFLRNGMTPEVKAAMSETSGNGAEFLPKEMHNQIITIMKELGVMRQLATVITTANDRDIPVEGAPVTATWGTEAGPYSESSPKVTQKTLKAFKLTALTKVSEELLQDSAFDVTGYIARSIAEQFSLAEEDSFINGDGSGKPTGFLGGTTSITSAVAGEIGYKDIVDLFTAVSGPYRAKGKWLAGDSAFATLLKLVDTTGRPIWQPSVVAGTPDMLLGKSLYSSPKMAAVETGNKPLAFGDFSQYYIADRAEMTLQRLLELYAGNGQVGFRAYKRTDGNLIVPSAIKTLEIQ